jgi:hypothetical protein
MKLIDQNQSATAAAVEIQRDIDELLNVAASKLKRIYGRVNTPGKEQAILDRIGQGDVPTVAALQVYVAFQQALEMARPGGAPAADLEVFVPQEDGSVLFVAPPPPVGPGLGGGL